MASMMKRIVNRAKYGHIHHKKHECLQVPSAHYARSHQSGFMKAKGDDFHCTPLTLKIFDKLSKNFH